MSTWQAFVASRRDKRANVSLYELRRALMEPPRAGKRPSIVELRAEEEKWATIEIERDYSEYGMLTRIGDKEEKTGRERRMKMMKRESKRQLRKIRKFGLDGIVMETAEVTFEEEEEEDPEEQELDELKERYDEARARLLREILRLHIGEVGWVSMAEEERRARLEVLGVEEKRLRFNGQIDLIGSLLEKSSATKMIVDLDLLLGEERRSYDAIMKERNSKRRRRQLGLGGEGGESFERERDAGEVFVELELRFEEERRGIKRRHCGVVDKSATTSVLAALDDLYETLEDVLLREECERKSSNWPAASEIEKKAIVKRLRLRRGRGDVDDFLRDATYDNLWEAERKTTKVSGLDVIGALKREREVEKQKLTTLIREKPSHKEEMACRLAHARMAILTQPNFYCAALITGIMLGKLNFRYG